VRWSPVRAGESNERTVEERRRPMAEEGDGQSRRILTRERRGAIPVIGRAAFAQIDRSLADNLSPG